MAEIGQQLVPPQGSFDPSDKKRVAEAESGWNNFFKGVRGNPQLMAFLGAAGVSMAQPGANAGSVLADATNAVARYNMALQELRGQQASQSMQAKRLALAEKESEVDIEYKKALTQAAQAKASGTQVDDALWKQAMKDAGDSAMMSGGVGAASPQTIKARYNELALARGDVQPLYDPLDDATAAELIAQRVALPPEQDGAFDNQIRLIYGDSGYAKYVEAIKKAQATQPPAAAAPSMGIGETALLGTGIPALVRSLR